MSELAKRLTKWYPPEIKPVRVGVYAIQSRLMEGFYSYWNGQWWGYRMGSVQSAYEFRNSSALGPIDKWRGLTRPARKGAKR